MAKNDLMDALRAAVALGDVEFARNVAQSAPKLLKALPDKPQRRTWMHLAAEEGCADMIRWLAGMGLSVEALDCYGFSPLRVAYYDSRESSAIEALLDVGADPNAISGGIGETLLGSIASTPGAGACMLPLMRLLMERGAVPDVPDKKKQTPLHHAAQRGDGEMAVFLLSHGANPHALTDEGINAFEVAERYGFSDTTELMRAWLSANAAQQSVLQALEDSRDWLPLDEAQQHRVSRYAKP